MTKAEPVATSYEITDTGLSIEGDMNFEAWAALGEKLLPWARMALFLVGDWFLWGEAHFGELAAQVVDEFSAETIRGAVWVCERVPPVRRRTALGFSVHKEVASLEAAEQDRLLLKAEQDGLTVRELRDEVRQLRAARKADLPVLPTAAATARRAVDAVDVAVRGLDSVDWRITSQKLRDELAVTLTTAHDTLGRSVSRLMRKSPHNGGPLRVAANLRTRKRGGDNHSMTPGD